MVENSARSNVMDIGAIEVEIKTFSLQDWCYTIDSNEAMGFLSRKTLHLSFEH